MIKVKKKASSKIYPQFKRKPYYILDQIPYGLAHLMIQSAM